MDLAKYIHDLLLENEIVIVPGFGAFVSEYKPAEINEGSDEIKPPSKTVTFNPQIRNNDGMLVGYVAEKKRSSHFDALKKIEKEREDIFYKLDNGDKVALNELGVLCYSEDNKIEFSAIQDDSLVLDSFGLEATIMDGNSEVKEKTILVEEIEEKEESTPEPEISEPEVSQKVENENTQEEEQESRNKTEEEQSFKRDDEVEIITETKLDSRIIEDKKQTKRRGWLWLLITLIPLLVVSVYLYINGYFNEGGNLSLEPIEEISTQQETALIPINDSLELDSLTITVQDTGMLEKALPDTIVELAPDKPRYYLVGGSFAIEENAETYLKELKDKGFDAFHVGKKGKLFIVGIATYDSFSEAEQAKKDYMRNNPGSEAWVYRK